MSPSQLVRICCDCHALYRPYSDQWMIIDDAMYHTILANYDVTHGYCPDCYTKQKNLLKRSKAGADQSTSEVSLSHRDTTMNYTSFDNGFASQQEVRR